MKDRIKLHDKLFKPFIQTAEIEKAIREIANKMNEDLADRNPIFLSVLNGSFMFTAQLFKDIEIDCEVTFIKLASYIGTSSTGKVKTMIGLDASIKDRTIVILEDIIDTGKTLTEFLPVLYERQAKEVFIATLLVKPEALKHPLKIDYKGMDIPDEFVVGYGLDYDGLGRNINAVYVVDESVI